MGLWYAGRRRMIVSPDEDRSLHPRRLVGAMGGIETI